jgi:cardiolipin synthase
VIRVSAWGVVAGALFLAADVVWLVLAKPPGTELLLAWFGLLVLVGAGLPGLANQATLARAHLAAPALVYSLTPSQLVELAAVVGLAGLSDVLDGTIARSLERPSRLGGALDPLVDGIFFGAVAVGLAVGGAYPSWLAAVVVARYGLPALAAAGLLLAGRRLALEHTPLGQASTVLIAVLLGGLALLRGLGWDARGLLLLSEVVVPLAAAATFGNLFWANRRAIAGSGGGVPSSLAGRRDGAGSPPRDGRE